jgi:hypothetical protein
LYAEEDVTLARYSASSEYGLTHEAKRGNYGVLKPTPSHNPPNLNPTPYFELSVHTNASVPNLIEATPSSKSQ